MELWNDFEGKTVDGRYPLERLLAPKGRSALFATKDEQGSPAVIRLIESLNDEDEILRRWNAVKTLPEEHLTHISQCNRTVLDGVHLVYAVMEPFDAELDDILRERSLSPDETKEMASGVAAALQALHAHGLVHEHVESSQVVARGEMVKLRSDLVREAGEGSEAAALRKRDAHDFAVLIQEALTRRREGGDKLPAPLDEMVRNGRSGAWGVGEMAAVLRPAPGPWASSGNGAARTPARPAAATGTASNGSVGGRTPAPVAGQGGAGRATSVPAKPATSSGTGASSTQTLNAGKASAAAGATIAAAEAEAEPRPRPGLVRDRIAVEPEDAPMQRKGLWAVAALGLLGAILLFWHFLHHGKEPAGTGTVAPTPAAQTAVNPPASGPQSGLPEPAPARPIKPSAARTSLNASPLASSSHAAAGARRPSAALAAAIPASPATAAHTLGQGDWRVVAFTYNHQDQAQHKAADIAEQHPDLKPEVFAPKAGSPYLVVLGGWMTSAEAAALRDQARSEGMPHDIYVQNYRH